ncbi:MAG: chitin binding domain-containing protein [Rickettsiales bacterium]|nr:chitin binding domain-containing protein [Rickettsiales bacterium]
MDENPVYTPDFNDCQSLYICGAFVNQRISCPDGLFWNWSLEICDWPENAGCVPGAVNTCSCDNLAPSQNCAIANGVGKQSRITLVGDCSSYYGFNNCSYGDDWGACVPQTCEAGYYMAPSPSQTICTPNSDARLCRPCSDYGSGYTCAGGTACPAVATCTSDCTYNTSQTASCGSVANGTINGTQTCNATKNGVSGCYTWGATSGCAVSCDKGYYLSDGQCVMCEQGYYCPGISYGSARYSCQDLIPGHAANSTKVTSDSGSDDSTDCHTKGNFWYWSGTGFWTEQSSISGTCWWGGSNFDNCQKRYWGECASGYYTVDIPEGPDFLNSCVPCPAGHYGVSGSEALYDGTVIYDTGGSGHYSCDACAAGTYQNLTGQTSCNNCTNKPANSSYSNSAGVTGNNCPWDCDSGYSQTDAGGCAQMCAAGFATLRAGSLIIPLYAVKNTIPSINIKSASGTVCYASLGNGSASNAINVNYSGNTYHTIR